MRLIPKHPALLLGLLSAMATSPLLAQNDDPDRIVIETITLQHRAPDGIRQALAAELLPGARINQIGEHLIIASTYGNVAQLRALAERLDTPPRDLRVSIDFAYQPPVPASAPPEAATEPGSITEPEPSIAAVEPPDSLMTRQAQEDQTLLLRYPPSSPPAESDAAQDTASAPAPALYLALHLTVLPGEQIQLSYGYSDNDQVSADMLQLITPGRWHPLIDDETALPVTPLEFIFGEAAIGQQLAVRVELLP